MTGLLLLDVDGPLNPCAAKPTRRPSGYTTYRLAGDQWLTGKEARRRKGIRVWLHPGHGAQLLALAEETGLSLAWATTWLHEANTYIAPAIGLPALPVVEFPPTDLRPVPGGHRWRRDGNWKWPGVATYAAGRPAAWLDDEHDDPAFAEARQAFDQSRAGVPTLLTHVDPRQGLQETHLDTIRVWAAGLT